MDEKQKAAALLTARGKYSTHKMFGERKMSLAEGIAFDNGFDAGYAAGEPEQAWVPGYMVTLSEFLADENIMAGASKTTTSAIRYKYLLEYVEVYKAKTISSRTRGEGGRKAMTPRELFVKSGRDRYRKEGERTANR